MIEITLSIFTIGLMSSILTELFKLIPILSENQLRKALTAITVVVFGTLYALEFNVAAWDWSLFINVLIYSFLNYRIIIKPIAKTVGLKTQ